MISRDVAEEERASQAARPGGRPSNVLPSLTGQVALSHEETWCLAESPRPRPQNTMRQEQ